MIVINQRAIPARYPAHDEKTQTDAQTARASRAATQQIKARRAPVSNDGIFSRVTRWVASSLFGCCAAPRYQSDRKTEFYALACCAYGAQKKQLVSGGNTCCKTAGVLRGPGYEFTVPRGELNLAESAMSGAKAWPAHRQALQKTPFAVIDSEFKSVTLIAEKKLSRQGNAPCAVFHLSHSLGGLRAPVGLLAVHGQATGNKQQQIPLLAESRNTGPNAAAIAASATEQQVAHESGSSEQMSCYSDAPDNIASRETLPAAPALKGDAFDNEGRADECDAGRKEVVKPAVSARRRVDAGIRQTEEKPPLTLLEELKQACSRRAQEVDYCASTFHGETREAAADARYGDKISPREDIARVKQRQAQVTFASAPGKDYSDASSGESFTPAQRALRPLNQQRLQPQAASGIEEQAANALALQAELRKALNERGKRDERAFTWSSR